tara:strand:- start:303 stop:821 length:519 start_codon:yes stop_codon:yes gene_type:complete
VQRTADGRLCVIADANILINFMKIGRLNLLRQLQTYAFRIPEEVYQEISYPAQRTELDNALDQEWIEKIEITDLNEIGPYVKYRQQMDDGEAACLTVAVCRKWVLACDERKKKVISREIQVKLGRNYLLNTPGILLKAIRENILTVDQADKIKEDLAQNRFVMPFESFRDLL